MRKDFYVFRHGETELNRQKRWQGSGTDCDLNAAGVRQAEELLEKFRGKKLEVIFSSPLIRARHTAEVVGAAGNRTRESSRMFLWRSRRAADCRFGGELSRNIEQLV